ncbi:MAG: response regulator transcription factor [Oscillospiraceae bacterium]|nr:response regulator transcription factor [Oscillospiraceae bacterium]
MDKKILIVEDEIAIVDILKFNLERDGYHVISAYDGEEGVRLAKEENPDLILLDVMLPKMDGFEVCKYVRSRMNTPIIMLTAREEEVDKVLGLELGADDYVTKPFSMRELLARVKANIRRRVLDNTVETDTEEEGVLRFGDLVINTNSMGVTKNKKPVELTPREFELIKFLATQPNKVFSREELMEKVWNFEFYGDLRTVDVTVRRLREKIEDNPAEPVYILTRRGAGYLFQNA